MIKVKENKLYNRELLSVDGTVLEEIQVCNPGIDYKIKRRWLVKKKVVIQVYDTGFDFVVEI